MPVADFSHAFQLPGDFLRVLSAGGGGRGRGLAYRIHERRLHANAESVTLTYIFRPDESTFPPFFDQTLIHRLAADFCLPLTESTSRAELLEKIAEASWRHARLIDAQGGNASGHRGLRPHRRPWRRHEPGRLRPVPAPNPIPDARA